MLVELQIEGLAIIERLSIEFTKGFNVLTGETGAGKSILIKAMQFLMGGKVSTDFMRKGSRQASVSGLFHIHTDHPIFFLLESLGIPIEKEGTEFSLLIRRLYTEKGRSQTWINDTPVTLTSLKEVEPLLLDVFSQHENQKLLEPSLHPFYLDRFLKTFAGVEDVRQLYQAIKVSVEELESDVRNSEEIRKNIDYWQFRLGELEEFQPSSQDYEAISSTLQESKNLVEQKKNIESVLEYFNEDSGGSVSGLLREMVRKVQKTEPDIASRLKPLTLELESIHFDLTQKLKHLAVDETEIERIKERQFGYKELFRKHAVHGPAELEAEFTRIKKTLESAEKSSEKFSEKLLEIRRLCLLLEAKCELLSHERRQVAKKVSAAIEAELEDLSMKGAVFEVIFEPVSNLVKELGIEKLDKSLEIAWKAISKTLETTSVQGKEKAHFFLSSNTGELCMPLEKIASGGEVSRIMLALKKILSTQADTCVLVFDEIDTGISGKVADQVGKKIQELSKHFQVLCISHLPQVAVYADKHFLVRKKEKGERTETSIFPLSSEESTTEIARLLSGEKISESSLANARTLLAKAKQQNKRSQSYVH